MSDPTTSVSPPKTLSYVHQLQVRVFYGDTDQMGVAYYANYLRWFEMARNEHLRFLGFPYAKLEEQGMVLPVVEAFVEYKKPARYDDLLEIDSYVEDCTRVRVRFKYQIHVPSRDPGAAAEDRVLLASGHTLHACLSKTGKPTRLPKPLLDLLHK